MKSVEPRLAMMDEAERHNQRLVGDFKALNLQKKKDEEVATLQGRVKELESEVQKLRDSVTAEKARADLAEEKIPGLEKQRDENAEDAKAAVAVTEGVLKAQLAVLIPEFDTSQISFFKEVVDGKVMDIQMNPPPS
ncbi:hypothetical protein PIB30_001749 [Stylosanthes scabra]|uniref:Uncharacterized protein n=1 Tax=Stylosanthes scabra TaxID=79078 RepID=A0ABU6V139_9FABA|nr:hypothetical protein [Stylosanthes scabra]